MLARDMGVPSGVTASTMNEDGDVARVRRDLRRGLAGDETFDALYAEPIRSCSSCFWTPVAVATRAAHMFARNNVRRVLDVGSGPGKFCLAAACACPDLDFTGVEQRPHLVEAARRAGTRLGVRNARFFVGDVTTFSWVEFGGLYLFNPFAENVFEEDEHIDELVELSTSRFIEDTRRVRDALTDASAGVVIVTYHGAGGPIPASYALVQAERAHTGWLRVWVKQPRDHEGTYYVEDGDDVLMVGAATGSTVTVRIPSPSTLLR
jgi:predicted RNA methylase